MSDYFSADLGMVSGIGTRMSEVSGTVRGGIRFVADAGAEGYAQVAGALADYGSRWDSAARSIASELGALGAASSASASIMRQHDESIAAQWSTIRGG
ncbi:MAG: hypothetical protein ACRCSN_15100 [Dermatophilaceae bacterium]